jgi:hypothetical protein
MAWKRTFTGGFMAAVGYLLSPLSWWNDLFVNVPLALLFAWLVSLVYKPAFEPCLILGYWGTNVLGFILLHKGAKTMFSDKDHRYNRRELLQDLLISIVYTALILALLRTGVLKPIGNYFDR